MKSGWRRVNPKHPCPICARPNKEHTSRYCLVTYEGDAAICPFTPEGSKKKLPQAGYLHILRNSDSPRGERSNRPSPPPSHYQAMTSVLDWTCLTTFYEQSVNSTDLNRLSEKLGVSMPSLRRLRVGICGVQTWAFPMTNAEGRILGIRIRQETGKKWAVKGTKDGLFIPRDLTADHPLVICEGPTDTAAMLDLGFNTIGRSNCHPWSELIIPLARGRWTVIVADTDAVGASGAKALCEALKEHCPDVRIVTPVGAKDAREWKRNGLTREAFLEAAYGVRQN